MVTARLQRKRSVSEAAWSSTPGCQLARRIMQQVLGHVMEQPIAPRRPCAVCAYTLSFGVLDVGPLMYAFLRSLNRSSFVV